MKVLIPSISVHCLQLFLDVYVYIPTRLQQNWNCVVHKVLKSAFMCICHQKH